VPSVIFLDEDSVRILKLDANRLNLLETPAD